MKSVIYNDFFFFLPFILSLFFYWLFFFKVSFFSVYVKKNKFEISSSKDIHYFLSNLFINKFVFLSLLPFFFFLINYKGFEETFWWNHFYLNNFNLNLITIFLLFFIIFYYFLFNFIKITENIKNDYFFSLIFIIVFSLLIYLANTFFTFIFVLECVSTTIFFKFISTKIWNDNLNNIINLKQNVSYKKYLNMLFFQFWSTFFSTVVLFFFLINLTLYFGTTEWTLVNYLFIIKLNYFSFIEKFFFFLLFSLFFFSFFIKIGFTPLHLYKIEIYKGLTFFSIFFYTTIYFLIYFVYFLLFIFIYFYSMINFFFTFLIIISLFSFFFLIIFMFDINYSKSFFAFSTISNSLIFTLLGLISNI